MKKSEAKARLEILRRQIDEHNHRYYILNNPVISDFEYDILLNELETIEKRYPELVTSDSPSQRVGNDITKEFRQQEHQYPMLSLGNTYNENELREFDERIRKIVTSKVEYVCELKYDGVSISITYRDGSLLRAVTRGDGIRGDDVTANVRTIKSIPLKISGKEVPSEFIIRGEILMPKAVFNQLNEIRIKEEIPPFANPRNAAAGTLKLLDPSVVASRSLECCVYSVLGPGLPDNNHYDNLLRASAWGFRVPDSIRLCEDINSVMQFIDHWEPARSALPYNIDGVVIKVNSVTLQEELGNTTKSPRWAIAYKYKAESALTRLLSVSFQVGRTGTVTPVANLEPILLSGSTVKRASLHNADQIALLDLHLNDAVIIEKGGEIIPKIIGVDISKRESNSKKVLFITSCPECGTPLIRNEGEANHFCPNYLHCPPQIKGRIEHFISRKAMDIDGLGDETIGLLFEQNLIRDPADLYELKPEQLIGLERMGTKSVSNIMRSIRDSVNIPYYRVIFALGIRHVGETVAKTIAGKFRSIDNLIDASFEELTSVPEIGPKIAASIAEYFDDEDNMRIVDRLRSYGIKLEEDKKHHEESSDRLAGKTVVISGTFNHYSREDYKKMINSNGGKYSSSVSKNTSMILAGDNMGKAKKEKAVTLGIPLVNETEFLFLIGRDI